MTHSIIATVSAEVNSLIAEKDCEKVSNPPLREVGGGLTGAQTQTKTPRKGRKLMPISPRNRKVMVIEQVAVLKARYEDDTNANDTTKWL